MGKAASFETKRARKVIMKPFAAKPNLRNQQRVEVSTEITIEKTDGGCLTCRVSNMSRTGVMVACDKTTASKLVPGMRPPAPGKWISVKARFAVPVLPTQPVIILADGNIVHIRRIARDEFQIGIQFSEFEGNGFDYVDRYVSTLLADAKAASADH
ncbi:MAG TPA: PilZ domain-containing protein [Marinobacter sp.]|nr:PilZ domain-containing protein [Marinobacter sp.]